MAQTTAEGPVTYPKISAKAWSVLRTRAALAPSTKFTPHFVAASLNMSSQKSARDNVVSHLRRFGLIDENGALTDLGNRWRVDASYVKACDEILSQIYPDDLTAFTTAEGAPDIAGLETWFQHAGFGGSNARQMAATYAMIASKKLPDANTNAGEAKSKAAKSATPARKVAPVKATSKRPPEERQISDRPPSPPPPAGPNVHLDIQIHIPAEATADQIEQIFASMAKHLYQR